MTLQSVLSRDEGDEGEEEDQRQTRGEKKADLIGQAQDPENLIGQAGATVGLIDCRVVMETSEEVVAHHLDELWHLGPGEARREVKEGGGIRRNMCTLYTKTHTLNFFYISCSTNHGSRIYFDLEQKGLP